MRIAFVVLGLASIALQQQIFNFGDDEPGKPPAGFEFTKTGKGADPEWVVEKQPDGERVLAQKNTDGEDKNRFPLCLVKDFSSENVRITTKIKMISGKIDQSGGIAWRLKDKDNYYLARISVTEGDVKLYTVKGGIRKMVERKDKQNYKLNNWYTLQVEQKGNSIKVLVDGQTLITIDDKSFPDAGKAGVWTRGDAVTYFDDIGFEKLK